ncbi:MAG: hypothetical protein CL675_04405 [Bdellovibrionaceae bacterium]|nr:hypothetical protein [Pseudobdellovibrionaceae bacterium]
MTKKQAGKSKDFDKYYYYHRSVQSPANDVKFLRKTYKQIRGEAPETLREDFCGTFSICCEWVKLKKHHQAIGIDIDPEPINYGRNNYYTELKSSEQERIQIIEKSVLAKDLPQADIVAAQNFSYYLFKTRKELLEYYKSAYAGVKDGGIFVADCFGGSQCMEPNEEETDHGDFSYYWDQDSFDPVTNEAMFYIHFKRKGEKKREKMFTYDWRMWTIPEIREIMEEAGFKETRVYWEGTTEDGDGDGEFKAVTKGEDCEAWVSYVVGLK